MRRYLPGLLRTTISRTYPTYVFSRRILSTPTISQCSGISSTSSLLAKKSKSAPPAKASKGKGKAVAEEDALSEADVNKILEKCKGKMEKVLEWAKGVAFEGVERGRGRVSPALLDSIKVILPDGGGSISLSSVASVTAKGMTLFVEVYDGDTMKSVESALHKANLPGMSPQKTDSRTLKIPVSRQTDAQRQQILKSLAETIESAKQQIRLARTESLKSLGGRGVDGADEVQELTDEHVKGVDELLARAKKEFEKV